MQQLGDRFGCLNLLEWISKMSPNLAIPQLHTLAVPQQQHPNWCCCSKCPCGGRCPLYIGRDKYSLWALAQSVVSEISNVKSVNCMRRVVSLNPDPAAYYTINRDEKKLRLCIYVDLL